MKMDRGDSNFRNMEEIMDCGLEENDKLFDETEMSILYLVSVDRSAGSLGRCGTRIDCSCCCCCCRRNWGCCRLVSFRLALLKNENIHHPPLLLRCLVNDDDGRKCPTNCVPSELKVTFPTFFSRMSCKNCEYRMS